MEFFSRWALSAIAVVVVWPAELTAADPLATSVSARLAAYEKKSAATVGMSIVDLQSGKPLVGIRADELRTPASNQKILTAAFALKRLGGDFNFTTNVYMVGPDVVVIGVADQLLGPSVRWAIRRADDVDPGIQGSQQQPRVVESGAAGAEGDLRNP